MTRTFSGGRPWDRSDRYNSEAAIFQINKVRTPTHMVAGADDIRVPCWRDTYSIVRCTR